VNQPALRDLFDFEEDEVIGRSSDMLFYNLSNVRAPGKSYECEVELERKDGTLFWGRVHVDDLRNQSGKITGSIAVVQNIDERIQIQEKLEAQLKEKEVLLNEIHHRVKNNLNIVSSLLNLQKGEIDSIEAAREAFDETCSRIHSIALIHESLYHSNNFSMIRMDAYIKNMVGYFNAYSDKSRHIQFEIVLIISILILSKLFPAALLSMN
jgi:PAS domain S-box-containing protein